MRWLQCILVAALACGECSAARADDFYRGRSLTIAIGAPAGGIYDLYARLFGRHLPDFIPGAPTIVMQNMPGAAGIRAANYLYNAAPKDGSYIALALDNLPLNAFLAPGEVKYRIDMFNWIGRGDAPVHLLFSWGASGIQTFEDAKRRDVLTAMMAPGTSSEMYPALANNLAGARFKLISGYEGSGGVNLALERGEVEAVGANSWINISVTKPDWIAGNKIRPLFQIGAKRDPVLPDTPTLLELVSGEEAKQIVEFLARGEEVGLYLIAPPGAPADRVAILRKAFDAMVADPAFIADAIQMHFEVHPLSGEELQKRAAIIATTPPDIVAKFKQAIVAR